MIWLHRVGSPGVIDQRLIRGHLGFGMHFGLTLELVRGFEVTTSSCPHAAELTTSVCKLYSLIMEHELTVSCSKQ